MTLPDPDLKWNEERGHYDFGAIDWDEFWRRGQRQRPVQPERLATRVRRWDDGAWVRDAALAHARQAGSSGEAHEPRERTMPSAAVEQDRRASEWPLWEVFVRSKQRPRPQALRQPARGRRRRWRCRWRATSTRGGRKASASGSCPPTRSSPSDPATRPVLRSDGGQDLPPPDLLRAARRVDHM